MLPAVSMIVNAHSYLALRDAETGEAVERRDAYKAPIPVSFLLHGSYAFEQTSRNHRGVRRLRSVFTSRPCFKLDERGKIKNYWYDTSHGITPKGEPGIAIAP